MRHKIYYSCWSHIGKYRSINQDNFLCNKIYIADGQKTPMFPLTGCISSEDVPLFGVFDGMGGEECGEVASWIAARCAARTVIGKYPQRDVLKICLKANREICEYVVAHDLFSMGTTAALLVFARNEIVYGNIGDSRIYRLSGNRLEQLSHDHYAVAAYKRKPPLSQNLGIPESEMLIEPHIARTGYHNGDLYLLCSDGLTDMVSKDGMTKILLENTFESAAGKLLDKALENGGRDNITILLCKVKREKEGFFDSFLWKKGQRKGEQYNG